MDRILRGEAGWQDGLIRALEQATRPIRTDARFAPRRAVAGESGLPRYDRASFPPARAAATLLLVYPGAGGDLTVPLTIRHADLRDHAGEISLPGGSVDDNDASHEAAALREAEEEIGVDPKVVTVAGVLDDVWIPVSNFELRPYVGMAIERPVLHLRADEVAQVIELPVTQLLRADAVSEELIEGPGWQLRAAVYRYEGHRIWGATARTLAMFAAVLEEADLRD
jgi:8-oxo-dGTP pyrophosphatase MutT (NUDIX family)